MDCTVTQLHVGHGSFPEGLFVVVTRAREAGTAANGGDGMNDGVGVAAAAAPRRHAPSLFVRVTDCQRCWTAPEVRAPPTTTLQTYLDEVACALAGGKGEDENERTKEKASTLTSSTSSSSSSSYSSTFGNAQGHSHSVLAEVQGTTGDKLELVVRWFHRETGDEAKVRIGLNREKPEHELGACRGVVSLALASARAAGAAAAELASQNAELASLVGRAQASAMGAESRWRAREGELFAKFAAVLNEKKAEAARWKQLAEAAGFASSEAAAASGAVLAAGANGVRVGGGGGGRGGGGGGGEAILVEGATAAAAAAAAAPAALPAADGDLANNIDYDEDNATTEEEEDRRSDSGGSRAVEEDEGFDDDEF